MCVWEGLYIRLHVLDGQMCFVVSACVKLWRMMDCINAYTVFEKYWGGNVFVPPIPPSNNGYK